MAKGDVTMRFDAETSAFIQKILAAKAALSQTEKSMDGIGSAAKKNSKNIDDMGGAQAKVADNFKRDMSGMVTGYLSIGAAIQGVKKIHDIFARDFKETTDRTKKSVQDLSTAVAGMGFQAQMPAIRRALHSPEAMQGMDIASRDALFATMAKNMEGADAKTVLAMTMAAGEGRRAGYDPTALGQTMAQLSDMMPGRAPDFYRNQAVQLMPHLGGEPLSARGKAAFLKYRELGLGTESEGLGLLAAFGRTGAQADSFGTFVEALGAPSEKLKRGIVPSGKDRFGAMSPQERFAALQRDPELAREVLGGTAPEFISASNKYRAGSMDIAMMYKSQAFEARAAEAAADPYFAAGFRLDRMRGIKETRKERDMGVTGMFLESEKERNRADMNAVSAALTNALIDVAGTLMPKDQPLTPSYPERPRDPTQ